ncbi:MAG: bifunctional oligoribonuclease/PAP phosphatase NrnA [Muribaculaceae bacterium]
MISRILKEEQVTQLRKYLAHYDDIVITCHVSPDGDAIGASLGLYHLLTTLGKNVNVVTPDLAPRNLAFLPGTKEIVAYSKYTDFATQLIANAKLIFCLDFNALGRLDMMADIIGESTAKKVMIDHHLFPEEFCDITISNSSMSSTCELLFRTICSLGLFNEINKAVAECLYTGMMTDTGNFSYNSNRADLYVIVAELIRKGIDKDRIYTRAMNTSTEERLRLLGFAISERMEVFPDANAALIILTKEDLERFSYKKGDTESLVNVPLGIPTIKWVIFMRQENDFIKISARSKGDFAVNTICEKYFNGGGHKNASGGEFQGTMPQAVSIFHKIIDNINEIK